MFHSPTTGLSVVTISPVIRPSSYSWLSPPGMPWKAGFVGKGWQLWVCRWNPFQPQTPSVAAVSPPIVYRALHLPPPPPAVHRRCIHKQYPGQLPGRVILVFSRATIIRENGGLWGGNGRRRVLSILSLSHLDNHRWDQADGGWIHPTKPRQGIYQFIFEWNIVHWKVVLY